MRSLVALLIGLPVMLAAQPGPPSFCFVLAEDRAACRPLERAVQVMQHYRERVPYVGMSGNWLKPTEALALDGAPLLHDSTEHWRVYHLRESMAESVLLVIAGTDTMRIELPEDQMRLWLPAVQRAGRDTPEVIRFRKGRFIMDSLVMEPWAARAALRMSDRLKAEDEAAYKRSLVDLEEYYRTHPPQSPTLSVSPLPAANIEEIMREIAQRPGLKEVNVDSTNDENVWVRFTGRVMLNGGCGSGMPLYGVEVFGDTGWVERIPFDPTQMDCGMPWVDWNDHTVMIPLAWWVKVNSREGEGELEPGSYRLVFMGANMVRMHTEAFLVSQ
ncbi:MAG: hypothetical protein ABI599_08175 [Flavobacteriales bacterium]